jgi:hypothetical protein
MRSETCGICASLLSDLPVYDEKSEKPYGDHTLLDCCGRVVCSNCLKENSRYGTYCPYCQHTGTEVSSSPGLPPYTPASSATASGSQEDLPEKLEKSGEDAPDVLHFVDAEHDSVSSLSLRYGVPASALRKTNNIFADHLLAARRTILIPGEFYKGGVSLSPRPIEGEEEELRKGKLRRWMVACKVPE